MVDLEPGRLDAALELFHVTYRALIEAPDRILDRRGLGRAHHRILYLIARRPDVTVSGLIAALQVSKQALHAPLRDLVGAGLVKAHAVATDGRAKALRLTAGGRVLEARLTGNQRERLKAAFEAAGPEAMNTWRAVMRAIQGHR